MKKRIVKLTESDLTILVKKIISEVGGISMESRSWSEILISEIKNSGGENFIINGKDFPKVYEKLPIDKFKIKFIPIGAYSYDQDNSGIIGDQYTITFIVDPRFLNKINVSVMNHEMKHAYQDFKRHENKSVAIKDSNFIKNMYTDDFGKIIIKFSQNPLSNDTLLKILYLYYILSDVEQTAYLENIYDELTTDTKFSFGSGVIMGMKLLDRIDFTDLNQKTWEEMIQSNIPFIKKFKSKEEFAKYSERYLRKLSDKFRKKINKMKYLNFQNK